MAGDFGKPGRTNHDTIRNLVKEFNKFWDFYFMINTVRMTYYILLKTHTKTPGLKSSVGVKVCVWQM